MPVNLSIHSNIRDYEVVFEESADFIENLTTHPHACFVVDENVWRLYADTMLNRLPVENVIVLPIHEERKDLNRVQELYDQLVEKPAKRNLTMVSIGGGILQDVSGFTASTIYRGIRWIFVPTTLLAQADSCIGSKTSLNYRSYKNLIGTFYPPERIHIYAAFLNTLEIVDFYSGLGEVIKLHLMGGRTYFSQMVELFPGMVRREAASLQAAISQSLNVKLSYMAGDEFDTGRRNLLNYGHDFGHALENTSHFDIPHGQAVVVGMLAANIVARQRGLLTSALEREFAEKLLIPGLMVQPSSASLDAEAMITAMKKDKKRTGEHLALIMMDSHFGFTRVNDLTSAEAIFSLSELEDRLGV